MPLMLRKKDKYKKIADKVMGKPVTKKQPKKK
jgi:hypothetical protein